jgi:uncharacterized protein YgbK (DUF1537 family)
VVADDVTGAADSAARSRHAGLAAWVLLEGGHWPDLDGAPAAVALTSDSRHLPPDMAVQRVSARLKDVPALPGEVWYKKIDSTLRGHIGAELDALLDWLGGERMAVVCPAFPAQGRGLEGGYLVHSQTPPRTLHLPTLLAGQSRRPVGELPLAALRAHDALPERLATLQAKGVRLVVADALQDADLATLVDAATAVFGDPVWCGSAGLAGAVAAKLAAGAPSAERPRAEFAMVGTGAILTVVGSGSPIAQAQIAQVAARPNVRVRTLDRTASTMDLVSAGNRPNGDWLIHLPPPAPGVALEGPAARAEAARLADVSLAVVKRLHPAALIVVGGDTAAYVLRALGLNTLEVVEELLPGIPLLGGVDVHGQPRQVVLKPGSFGDAGTLAQLYDLLQQRA